MQFSIKRFVPFLIAALMLSLVLMPSISSADDITGHYAEDEMRALNDLGIMEGDAPGVFSPNREVSRAEFSAFVKRALELDLPTDPSTASYTDVDPEAWYYDAITQASAANIITGYPDGTFKPNQKISREEMAVIMSRALLHEAIETEQITLDFTDKDKIHEDFLDEVAMVASVKLIEGYPDNTYRPKNNTKRADAALVIYRMLNVINPPPVFEYSVANITSDGVVQVDKFETFQQAKDAITSPSKQVVMEGKKIVWMDKGISVANGFTIIYTSKSFGSNYTYVTTGSEMQYHGAGDGWVEVTLADTHGYVKTENVTLTPYSLLEGRSYYTVSGGDLIHHIYSTTLDRYSAIVAGKAPSFMNTSTNYYSWDGNEFFTPAGYKAGQAYQYYQYLPLYTKTKYTADQLDAFIKATYTPRNGFSSSPLEGTGAIFKKVEADYGVNALYLLSHAIHESNWGTSRIAVDKNNLFGLGAIDGDAYDSAITFDTLEDGIVEAASQYIIPGYFDSSNWRYRGPLLGNKSMGMNVKYASDPYWGEKISAYMYKADKYLMGGDLGKYRLGMTTTDGLNVRSEPRVASDTKVYELPLTGTSVAIIGDSNQSDGTWYQIVPRKGYTSAYIYANGSLGTLAKKINVAQ